jgi:uncharacterized protein YukE
MSTAELHAAAALLDDRAQRIDAAADTLASRIATATWAGPAADRFRTTIIGRRNEMRAGADALRAAAHAMRLAGGRA